MRPPSPPCGSARVLPWRMAWLLCAPFGLTACASAGQGAAPQPGLGASATASAPAAHGDRAAEAAVQQRIEAAIGDAACRSDTQCRTLAVGANACGGPAAWRPWSAVRGDGEGQGAQLKALADQLSALQRQRYVQAGMVSTCRYIPDPGAVCQAQRCVLKQAADPAN